MEKINCCCGRQDAKLYEIEPDKEEIKASYMSVLPSCAKCGATIVEIRRIRKDNTIDAPIRINPKRAGKILSQVNIKREIKYIPHYEFYVGGLCSGVAKNR